ncbi:MAG TPA: hypothetical protein VI365_07975 [Trebonia sp.]
MDAAATEAVAVAFANTISRSAGSSTAGNRAARTRTVRVPASSVTRRPPALIASTCARQPSSSSTSCPDASAAPNRHPIAPAPAIVIFMSGWPSRTC